MKKLADANLTKWWRFPLALIKSTSLVITQNDWFVTSKMPVLRKKGTRKNCMRLKESKEYDYWKYDLGFFFFCYKDHNCTTSKTWIKTKGWILYYWYTEISWFMAIKQDDDTSVFRKNTEDLGVKGHPACSLVWIYTNHAYIENWKDEVNIINC